MGTVYRHFPTKEALLEALAREQFEILTAWAREAQDEPDAWAALEAMIWRGAELQASDRALMEAVAEFKPSVARQAEELQRCDRAPGAAARRRRARCAPTPPATTCG